MRLRSAILVIAALSVVLPLGTAQDQESRDTSVVADGSNGFGFRLLRELGQEPGNLFFSPLSISAAFGMTWAGTESEVYEEIGRVLGFSLEPERFHPALARLGAILEEATEGAPRIRLANRIFGGQNERFEESFTALLESRYRAGLERVDFADEPGTRRIINTWVAGRTDQMIPELVAEKQLSSLTVIALVNAIVFQGRWETPFEARWTKPAPFTLPDGTTTPVPLMHRRGKAALAETASAEVLRLPYAGGGSSLWIVLPRTGRTPADAVNELDPAVLRDLDGRFAEEETSIQIPRFEIEARYGLHEKALPALGLKAALALTPHWTPMTGRDEPLGISVVIHAAKVKVDEEGTKAAAATLVAVARGGAPAKVRTFRADRPFLFMVRHDTTGAMLFLGRFEKPAA